MADAAPAATPPAATPSAQPATDNKPVSAGYGLLLDLNQGFPGKFSGSAWTVVGQDRDGTVLISRQGRAPERLGPKEFETAKNKKVNKDLNRQSRVPAKLVVNQQYSAGNAGLQILGLDRVKNQYQARISLPGGRSYTAWVDMATLNKFKTGSDDQSIEKLAGIFDPSQASDLAAAMGSETAKAEIAEQEKKSKEAKSKKGKEIKETEVVKKPTIEAGGPSMAAGTAAETPVVVPSTTEEISEEEMAAPAKPQATREFRQTFTQLQANPRFQQTLQQVSWQTLKSAKAPAIANYSGVSDQGFLIQLDGKVSAQRPTDLVPAQFQADIQTTAVRQFAGTPGIEFKIDLEQFPAPTINLAALGAAAVAPAGGAGAIEIGATITTAAGIQGEAQQKLVQLNNNLRSLYGRLDELEGQRKQALGQLADLGKQKSRALSAGDFATAKTLDQDISRIEQNKSRTDVSNLDTRAMIADEQGKIAALQGFSERSEGRDQVSDVMRAEFDKITPLALAPASRPGGGPPPIPPAVREASRARVALGLPPTPPSRPTAASLISKQIKPPLRMDMSPGTAAGAGDGMSPEARSPDQYEDAFRRAPAEQGWSGAAAGIRQPAEEEVEEGGGRDIPPSAAEQARSEKERQAQMRRIGAQFSGEPGTGMEEEEGAEPEMPMGGERRGPARQAPGEMEGPETEDQMMAGLDSDQARAARRKGQGPSPRTVQDQRMKMQQMEDQAKKLWRTIGNFDKGFDVVGGMGDGVQLIKLIIGWDIALIREVVFHDTRAIPYLPQPMLPEKYAYFEACLAVILHFLVAVSCCVVGVGVFVIFLGPYIAAIAALSQAYATLHRLFGGG